MSGSFIMEERFAVSPSALFAAWLDSEQHTVMTGGAAVCSGVVGGAFSAWDGYITGTNQAITEGLEIVQSWRTAEFDPSDEDSKLTLQFVEVEGGSVLRLIHEDIPDGQPDYEQGWRDHYFQPMKEFFGS